MPPTTAAVAASPTARGPRPAYVSRRAAVAGFLMWPAMAVITFFFASMPALHAQWKLASGTGLVYRVETTADLAEQPWSNATPAGLVFSNAAGACELPQDGPRRFYRFAADRPAATGEYLVVDGGFLT